MIPETALTLIGPRTSGEIASVLDSDGQDPASVPVRVRAMLLSARLGIPSRISDEFLARDPGADSQVIADLIEAAGRGRATDPEWLKMRDLVEQLYSKACILREKEADRAKLFGESLRELLGVSPAVAAYALSDTAEVGSINMPFERVVSRGAGAAKVELAGGQGYRVEGRDLSDGTIAAIFFTMSQDEAIDEMGVHMAELGFRDISEITASLLVEELEDALLPEID